MDLFTFGGYHPHSSLSRAIRRPEERMHNSFLRFLSIAVALKVNIFPLTWQPALEDLGEGSTGQISQSPLNSQTSFAFKRFTRVNRNPEMSDAELRKVQYEALISEMVVLSHADIYDHPNIANLEGVCWEVMPESEEVWPVLVFRKAEGGDLSRFLSLPGVVSVDSDDLLAICGEVAKALMIMHRCGIAHGDIKPENVLISKGSEPSVFGVKMTDFGFSCFECTDNELVRVARSRPWEAPEWHDRWFHLKDIKKMDVYSFGLLCLWILFPEDNLVDPDSVEVNISLAFSGSDETALERLYVLKRKDTLKESALRLISQKIGLNENVCLRLQRVFSLSLAKNAEKRAYDMQTFVDLLCSDDNLEEIDRKRTSVAITMPSWHGNLELAKFHFDIEACDFRVQSYVAQQLTAAAKDKGCTACSSNAAFQLAQCYSFGFGVKKDIEMRKHWLQQSEMNSNDLEEALESIRRTEPSTFSMAQLIELGYQNQLAEDYEKEGILPQAAAEYEAMVSSRDKILGPDHFSTTRLRYVLAGILHRNGQLRESAALVVRIIESTEHDLKTHGENRLVLKSKLSLIYKDLGKFEDSEVLMQEVLEGYSSGLKKHEVPRVVTLFHLSSISLERGRNEEAVGRSHTAAIESTLVLGPSHNNSIMAKSALATGYARLGELEKAIELNEEVARVREGSLGSDDPDTIETLDRLGLQYYKLGKYEISQDRYKRVIEARVLRFGRNAPSVIRAISSYTAALTKLGQAKEAAALQEELLAEIRTSLGVKNAETINLMGNLGVTYQTQGLWHKAEPLEKEVFSCRQEELGNKHEYTLTAMSNLSDTLVRREKWDEAARLSISEFEIRQTISSKPDQEKLKAVNKAAMSLARLENWEATIYYLERELACRTALGNNDHTEHLQVIALAATTCMKLQEWVMARGHLAAFLEASIIRNVEVRSVHSDTIHNLAMSCQETHLLEEAEQLFILEILTLQHFDPGDSTTLEDRVKTVIELKKRQGKPVNRITFNPSSIIERARLVKEQKKDDNE